MGRQCITLFTDKFLGAILFTSGRATDKDSALTHLSEE